VLEHEISRRLDQGGKDVKKMVVALVAVATVVALPISAPAATKVLGVTPRKVNFGAKPVGSTTFKSVTVTNASSDSINLNIGVIKDWDDFETGVLPGTTCTFSSQLLAPGESCVVVVRFSPSEGFEGLKQDQILRATATDPLTGELLDSVQIVFVGMAR
jgi:hypothetical protein